MAQEAKEVMDYKLVIAVRDDLKMSAGKIAVQVAHAAVECVLETKRLKPRWFMEWKRSNSKKVVVKVKDEEALVDLKKRAEEQGLIAILITDAGLTEVPPGTKTAIGIGPAPSSYVDKLTGSLPLL